MSTEQPKKTTKKTKTSKTAKTTSDRISNKAKTNAQITNAKTVNPKAAAKTPRVVHAHIQAETVAKLQSDPVSVELDNAVEGEQPKPVMAVRDSKQMEFVSELAERELVDPNSMDLNITTLTSQKAYEILQTIPQSRIDQLRSDLGWNSKDLIQQELDRLESEELTDDLADKILDAPLGDLAIVEATSSNQRPSKPIDPFKPFKREGSWSVILLRNSDNVQRDAEMIHYMTEIDLVAVKPALGLPWSLGIYHSRQMFGDEDKNSLKDQMKTVNKSARLLWSFNKKNYGRYIGEPFVVFTRRKIQEKIDKLVLKKQKKKNGIYKCSNGSVVSTHRFSEYEHIDLAL